MKHPSPNPTNSDPEYLSFNQFALILEHEPEGFLDEFVQNAREKTEEYWSGHPRTSELGPIIDNDVTEIGDRPWTVEDYGCTDWYRLNVEPDFEVNNRAGKAISGLVTDTEEFINLWIENLKKEIRRFRRQTDLSPRLFTSYVIRRGGAWKAEVAPYLNMGEFEHVDAYTEAEEILRRPERRDKLRALDE